ncbi:MAG: DNA polymerase Y family protein [Desulfosalsimonas sp.]
MVSTIKSFPTRAIVHINVADFAASVEQRADPRLKRRPLIVAPYTGARAPVYDMSEEAYQAGVRKAMPVFRARRMCRDAVVVPPSPELYDRAMKALFREVSEFSPLAESGDADGHFFADVTGTGRLFGPPHDAARRMYLRIRECFGLRPVWSVAANKLVSKVATRVVKPVGECVVGQGEEPAFLSPLRVSLLPGITAADTGRLRDFNLERVGQVAALSFEDLETIFGRRAGFIHDSVRGIDTSRVLPARQKPRKISAFCRFSSGIAAADAAERQICGIAEKLGAELRSRGRAAGSLVIAAEYADGLHCFRRMSLEPPSADDITLFETCRALLKKAWLRRVRLNSVCVSCPNPVAPQVQMELFSQNVKIREKRNALAYAADRIRERFGNNAVFMAGTFAGS